MQQNEIIQLLDENQRLLQEYAESANTNMQLRHRQPIPFVDPDDRDFDPMAPLNNDPLVTPQREDDVFQLMRKNARLREEIVKMNSNNQELSDLILKDSTIIDVQLPLTDPMSRNRQ